MKIDIVTLHRAQNYGSVLQTFALQKQIEELGHQASILDYYPERYTNKGLLKRLKNKSRRFKNPLVLLIAKLLIYPSYLRKGIQFNKFMHYLNLEKPSFATNEEGMGRFTDADAYCAGSDQIWNSHWNEGVEKALFLDFVPKGKLCFSYAASIGLSNIPANEIDETKLLLDKFEFLSLREDKGVELVKELGRTDAVQCLDPTLLMSKEEWSQYADDSYKGKEYVLTYNLHHDPEIDKCAKAIASKYHLQIRNISYNWHDIVRHGHLDWCPTVEGFLGLIKNAKYVVADSFHATAFSIIFEKPFVVITPEVASSRLSSLLKMLGLDDHNINKFTSVKVIEQPIDYIRVKSIIATKQRESISFLNKVFTCKSFTHNR
ncbi:polysaccharide pyruvyl transferase family protein [Segatella hominis]|uniref:polysaccharide pyruvyl transferase family protein n=1 Tax=Segatella hominis TaxID=2518605 RepID=UPI003AB9AE78